LGETKCVEQGINRKHGMSQGKLIKHFTFDKYKQGNENFKNE
jgi:hypothetical protein